MISKPAATPPGVLLFFSLLSGLQAGDACQADETTLCLQLDRFRVRVEWSDPAESDFTLRSVPAAGDAEATDLSPDSGYFTFPNPRGQQNTDLLVKVLDACSLNGRYWVLATSPSDLGITVSVLDTATATERVYENVAGKPFAPVVDTSAFETCDAGSSPRGGASGSPASSLSSGSRAGVPSDSATGPGHTPKGVSAACVDGPNTLCLQEGRFRVETERNAFDGWQRSLATRVTGSEESGLVAHFVEDNQDTVVQVLDGRGKNGHFWVFLAHLNDVEYTVRVTDTLTDRTRTYHAPLGPVRPATLDNRAFGEVSALVFPQVAVGDVSEDLSFDVELGLSNPNSTPLQVEIEMLDGTLAPVLDIEMETLFSEATGQEGGPSDGHIEIPARSGVTVTIRILPAPAVQVLRLVQGFLIVRTLNPLQGDPPLAPAVTSFSYNLRERSEGVLDRIPVAATLSGRRFQLSASRRADFDTGMAVATPDGAATIQVEVFLDSAAPQGSDPASLVTSFFLAGQRAFFLGDLFGEELPAEFESVLVEIRSTPGESAFGDSADLAPIAVTALDVLTPPAGPTIQIAGKEVRRVE